MHIVASRQTATATSILRVLLAAAGKDIRLKADGVSDIFKIFHIYFIECQKIFVDWQFILYFIERTIILSQNSKIVK